jgi:high frequency lysogenization protein
MSHSLSNRAIALAGLYQCVDLVTQIAWQGRYHETAFAGSIGSLFRMDAETYLDVYGDLDALRSGLEALRAALRREGRGQVLERTRYAVMLLYLERRLRRDPRRQEQIATGIRNAATRLTQLAPTHMDVIDVLAELYRETISTLGPRIIVKGEPDHLSRADNAARIRALLLAGIRAAWLWRQAGGSRLRLLLERPALLREIDAMLGTG